MVGKTLNLGAEAWINTPNQMGVPIELLPWEYRHRKKLVGATTLDATLTFFNVKKGDTEGAVTLNEDMCNMEKAGAIASPQKFLVQAIAVDCQPYITNAARLFKSAATLALIHDDIVEVLSKGFLRVKVQQKEYLNIGPLWRVPSGAGAHSAFAMNAIQVASGGTEQHEAIYTMANGMPTLHNVRRVEIPLNSEAPFTVTVEFPTSQPALVSGNDLELGIYLIGVLQRAIL